MGQNCSCIQQRSKLEKDPGKIESSIYERRDKLNLKGENLDNYIELCQTLAEQGIHLDQDKMVEKVESNEPAILTKSPQNIKKIQEMFSSTTGGLHSKKSSGIQGMFSQEELKFYNPMSSYSSTASKHSNKKFVFEQGMEEADYEQEIDYYNRILEKRMNDITALDNRSLALSELRLYDEALNDAELSLSIDKKNAYAYNNKATALIGQGSIDLAIKTLKEAH